MGDIIFGFPRAKKDTSKSSKNNGLVCTKYNIAFPIILYY
jgi:hypothetical protein